MNIVAFIILTAIVTDFLLNFIADSLNLGALQKCIPESFQDVYKAEAYERSQAYLRVNTLFGRVVGAVDLILLLVFWFAGGFQLLDQWVRALGVGPIASGLIFIAILMLLKSIIALPFGIYATFVIEARFGFNRTTWKTYVADKVKGAFLAVLLGGPLLFLVLWFFEKAGDNAWWFCWMAVTLFTLTIQFVAPTLIMPLFNKFIPLEEGELKAAILSYAQSIRFPLKNVMVMDGSKRSAKSNAFFTGFGRHKRIVLFDTLIERHEVDELVAVLAHEMGHYRKRHIVKMMAWGVVQTGIMFYILSLMITQPALFSAFYVETVSIYAGLIFFGLLYSPMDFFLGLITQMLSRRHEYEADRFAVASTRKPGSMISALKKLSVHNLSNLLPHPFYVFLHYSHPPVLERIRQIDNNKKAGK